MLPTKLGRPKSDNPKSNRITIRLDNETYEMLERYCKKKQIEKSEAIRKGIKHLVEK